MRTDEITHAGRPGACSPAVG